MFHPQDVLCLWSEHFSSLRFGFVVMAKSSHGLCRGLSSRSLENGDREWPDWTIRFGKKKEEKKKNNRWTALDSRRAPRPLFSRSSKGESIARSRRKTKAVKYIEAKRDEARFCSEGSLPAGRPASQPPTPLFRRTFRPSVSLRVVSQPPRNSISKHGETWLCATFRALAGLK